MKTVLLKRKGGQTTLYFKQWAHHPQQKTVRDYLDLQVFKNNCSYADTTQMSNGEITINFNPLNHKKSRKNVERELVNMIEDCN